jgi:hypothetical protein
MTETQRKFLTEYLGEKLHKGLVGFVIFCDKTTYTNRTFTELKDKQDLLEAVIKKEQSIYNVFSSWSLDTGMDDFVVWLIKLSPLETADLICRWKGVE